MTSRGVTPRVHGRPLQRPARRTWPPNVLRRVAPVEPSSLAREVVNEVVAPALACAAACAALAAWLL
ncbi:MAG: hypothetical protein RIS45_121 [Planctomycetota bacterium]|jgi:hypothetical protein